MKPNKTKVNTRVDEVVNIGTEYIIRGLYDQACGHYKEALSSGTDHYLIRNALGEVYFIQKEFLSAADNFWLAALDAAEQINLGLLQKNRITDFRLRQKRNREMNHAKKIVLDYSKKSGLSLFAHQYEDPLKKNTQQALINLYRNHIDPCGYQGCVEADPNSLARIEKNVQMVGYRFLKKMNQENFDSHLAPPPLDKLLDLFQPF